ncbi:MAG: NupC/NupG family nucleoside CNT transporter [Candidatus Marinimicrobia bacterium]|nr:NupC/NupG family nucleoside CNT transporter [Candidatus Neomarinimicrobiota bacterium]|tara:strand:- start:276 stop:1511 length:1236 start_codon:yes stop_codon:yes gene_type:complete
MERFIGILGIFAILGIAFLMSNNKRNIDLRVILWGLGLQILFGVFILVTPFGKPIFSWFDTLIKKLLSFSGEGSEFLFASFMDGKMHPAVINFAFAVLPTVIFFSALMAVLYHIGLMQKIIKVVTLVMQKTMKTSGPETTSISANIFVGQTEAPLVIKPFVSKMTKSELMAVMTGGFATVAGGVMAIYVGMLENVPGIAGHLMAASIMSAPAALVVAKIMYPETEKTNSPENVPQLSSNLNEPVEGNVLESLGNGATDGLKLAANIAAMLIAFVALIALSNYMLSMLGTSLEEIFGYIFMPLAFLMGAPWSESHILGSLLGQKIVLTELIAYMNLADIQAGENPISDKTAILASYALCGFANFASIGIQLGGIGSIAPERKKDLAKLVTKAMFGGALASWLTATIAGILIY